MGVSEENTDITILDYDIHMKGDKGCRDCKKGFPIDCDCGGLIHAVHDSSVRPFVTLYKCDSCGRIDKPL